MTADLTVIGPRKDRADPWRNTVQAATRAGMGPVQPYVTGTYRSGSPRWSMSRAVNLGRRRATTPKLLITPADYLIHPEHIAAVSALLDAVPWVGVYARCTLISERATRDYLAGGPVSREGATYYNVCQPCVAVRADVFDDVGGMDARFNGRAPEDVALRIKLHTLYGPPPPPVTDEVIELWSPDGGGPTDPHNDPLFNRYLGAIDDPAAMRALIAETRGVT